MSNLKNRVISGLVGFALAVSVGAGVWSADWFPQRTPDPVIADLPEIEIEHQINCSKIAGLALRAWFERGKSIPKTETFFRIISELPDIAPEGHALIGNMVDAGYDEITLPQAYRRGYRDCVQWIYSNGGLNL